MPVNTPSHTIPHIETESEKSARAARATAAADVKAEAADAKAADAEAKDEASDAKAAADKAAALDKKCTGTYQSGGRDVRVIAVKKGSNEDGEDLYDLSLPAKEKEPFCTACRASKTPADGRYTPA